MANLGRQELDFDAVRELWLKVEAIAGFKLPHPTFGRFWALGNMINRTPLPDVLVRLRKDPDSTQDWLKTFTVATLTNIPDGLGASYYHLSNIEAIERGVTALAVTHRHLWQPGQGVAGGNTARLDYEYQAFLFALRRTLEYLAKSVCAFFKQRHKSIKKVADTIKTAEPSDIRERVLATLKAGLDGLPSVLSLGPKRSPRDRLAHWETFDAGVLNIDCGPSIVAAPPPTATTPARGRTPPT